MAPAKAKKARSARANAKRTTRQTNTGSSDGMLGPHTALNDIGELETPADTPAQRVENPVLDADLAREITAMRGQFLIIDGIDCKLYTIDISFALTAELEKERLQNAELRKRIEDMPGHVEQDVASTKPMPRPKGTAGTNFSIQEAMGLTGSVKKYETYKGIQVGCDFYWRCCDAYASRSATYGISQ